MRAIATILGLTALGAAGVAHGQQYNQPWGFTPQNRAQMAVIMEQMENGGSGAIGGGVAGGVGGTTIVCGGGSATAQANNTCIILNNSDGMISTDQVSDGEQSATSSTTGIVNGETATDADEVLTALTGGS